MVNLRRNFELEGVPLVNFINLNDEEKEMLRNWRNHDDIRKLMYSNHIISPEEHKIFIDGLNGDNKNFYWLVKGNNGEYVGVISLNRVDFNNKNSYIGIYANPDCNLPGVGQILMDCLKKIAFEIAGLHTLKLEVMETNEKAMNFYTKSGFAEEGKLKEFVFKDGKWQDVIIMGTVNKQEE